MKYRTQFTNEPKWDFEKKSDLPSMTVPDQNLSLRVLLDKHSRNIPTGVSERQPLYFDTEIPRIEDLNDLEVYRNELANRAEILRAEIDRYNEMKRKQDEHKNPT